MGLDFVAIDFETANRSHASMCAVGAVKVRDGVVVDTFSSLIRPPEGFDDFEPANVRVHQIQAEAVEQAASWLDIYPSFRDFVGDDVIVGHHAAFDSSVLLNTCGAYDIDLPTLSVVCTLRLARAALQLPSYALPWVASHLGVPRFDHHDPLEDARATAAVLIALAGNDDLSATVTRLNVPVIATWTDRDDALLAELGAEEEPPTGTGFSGEVVCFTGALKMMVRDRARELVVEQGGTWQASVTKTTSVLVTGDFDESTFRPGAAFSSKLAKAFAQVEGGQRLEIITEEAFITRMTVGEQELRARLGVRNARSKVPDWVVGQAGNGPGEGDFWDWYRAALAHPQGRAREGTACIWCSELVPVNAHWIHRDRHVCGVHCNERFKRGAKRAWLRAGIPIASESW